MSNYPPKKLYVIIVNLMGLQKYDLFHNDETGYDTWYDKTEDVGFELDDVNEFNDIESDGYSMYIFTSKKDRDRIYKYMDKYRNHIRKHI